MEIKKTTDYGIFKKIVGNRRPNPNHIKALESAISEHDLLPENPIIVNEQMEIIDGQHRLAAAQRMRRPIYYVIKKGASLDEIRLLNTHVILWHLDDYLQSYVQQGKEDYLILQEFARTYNLGISVALSLLSGADTYKPYLLIKKFKAGDFTIQSYEEAKKRAEQLKQLEEFCDKGVYREREFVFALKVAYKTIDHQDLLERLQKYGLMIKHERNVSDYLRQLEEIANFRNRGNHYVRLF